jgi:hypothetical protein
MQFGAASCTGGSALLLALRCFGLRLGDSTHLEFFDRACHLADFVLAAEARQHDIEIAAGELTHRVAHADHRARNTAAQASMRAAHQHDASAPSAVTN